MDGRDIRDVANMSCTGDLVVFEDMNGKIHDVYGARRVRADGVSYLILSEDYLGFGELKLDKNPSKSLTDRLNEYNEQYFNKRYGK